MEGIQVQRLDHLGIIAGTIKELKIIEMIDERIPTDDQESISCGEAIAGMILNGLGFSQRPVSLTPQFFENKPLEQLFRPGVKAEHFNRFKLGRSLDDTYEYGNEALFSEIALAACRMKGVNLRFNHLDTTSLSVTGEYLPDSDEAAVLLTHGYSKDHRPDLKQVIQELIVSQDGGIPWLSQSWSGNTSDNEVFRKRCEALLKSFQNSPSPRYVVMDSKGYCESNAENLKHLGFIVAVPATLSLYDQLIQQSFKGSWTPLNETYEGQSFELCHFGIAQRWLVIHSQQAADRAQQTVDKQIKREKQTLEKQLLHLQAKRFASRQEALDTLQEITLSWKLHQLQNQEVLEHPHYAKRGKPKTGTPVQTTEWQICAQATVDTQKTEFLKFSKSCFILATSIDSNQLSDPEVLQAYKQQSHVERGFRFLKDPLFFVSSLFLKKPARIEALLMVMTLALLVYSIAQRTVRAQLTQQKETLPDQILRPTATPTLRWLFQCLEGIHVVAIQQAQACLIHYEGITPLRRKILLLFGEEVARIYQIF